MAEAREGVLKAQVEDLKVVVLMKAQVVLNTRNATK